MLKVVHGRYTFPAGITTTDLIAHENPVAGLGVAKEVVPLYSEGKVYGATLSA
jgi:hypothetical protein